MDALVNSAGKLRYLSGGQFALPAGGAGDDRRRLGRRRPAQPQPGGDVRPRARASRWSCRATPADSKGLLKAAIRDDNPVLFFIDIGLLLPAPGEVPDGEHTVPLGKAAVLRGRAAT